MPEKIKGPFGQCVDDDCESSLVQAMPEDDAPSNPLQPIIDMAQDNMNDDTTLLPNAPWNVTVNATSDDSGGEHMSSGLLAGAVLGGAVVLGIVLTILIVYKWRKHRRKQQQANKTQNIEASTSHKVISSIQLANQAVVLPSPFLTSISTSTTLRRDPVLSWVASELGSADRLQSERKISITSNTSTETSAPETSGSNGSGSYRLIDVNEISIQRLIGEGSYGRVFAASWHQTPVAFKMLVHPKTIADEEAAKKQSARVRAALERECNLMSSLRHPHIVQFIAACAFPPGILTDWCSRGSLHEVLQLAREDPACAAHLTWHRRLALALDAAKGMLYLHSIKPPVLHRDLKTANLLVTRDWTCKVADFNLSRLLDDDSRSGGSGSAPGNPRFLAPEIFSPSGDFSTASDVYSFAMVMLELLIWEVPFKGRNEWAIVGLVQQGYRPEIPIESEMPRSSPIDKLVGLEEYIELMKKAWSQEPEVRPTFDEITATLRKLVMNCSACTD